MQYPIVCSAAMAHNIIFVLLNCGKQYTGNGADNGGIVMERNPSTEILEINSHLLKALTKEISKNGEGASGVWSDVRRDQAERNELRLSSSTSISS